MQFFNKNEMFVTRENNAWMLEINYTKTEFLRVGGPKKKEEDVCQKEGRRNPSILDQYSNIFG